MQLLGFLKNQTLNKKYEIFISGEVAPNLSPGKCSTLLCKYTYFCKYLEDVKNPKYVK